LVITGKKGTVSVGDAARYARIIDQRIRQKGG
jgi:hypothetical protein